MVARCDFRNPYHRSCAPNQERLVPTAAPPTQQPQRRLGPHPHTDIQKPAGWVRPYIARYIAVRNPVAARYRSSFSCLGGKGCGLIDKILIGHREALEFECDCADHYGRGDRRAWFQIFGSYTDGVLTALCCGWTEKAAGWYCPRCSRETPSQQGEVTSR
jgi:hypothetical protein